MKIKRFFINLTLIFFLFISFVEISYADVNPVVCGDSPVTFYVMGFRFRIWECSATNPITGQTTTFTWLTVDMGGYPVYDIIIRNNGNHKISDDGLSLDMQNTFDISVYPNPANGFINLESKFKIDDVSNIKIYDLQMNEIQINKYQISSTTYTCNLSNLMVGNYLIVINHYGNDIIKSFIINR